MTAPFAYPRHDLLKGKMDLYWSALKEAGHDPATREVLGVYHLYVAETDEAAHALAKKHFMQYLTFFAGLDRQASFQSEDYKEYKGGLSKGLGGLTYEAMDKGDCFIFGSPETCVQRLKRAQAGFGLTYPIFEVNFGGFPHKDTIKSLELFAKHVMPHLR